MGITVLNFKLIGVTHGYVKYTTSTYMQSCNNAFNILAIFSAFLTTQLVN